MSRICDVEYCFREKNLTYNNYLFLSRFLFETTHQSYLYTGDFRYVEGDIKKNLLLRSKKKIDRLYFDATFLNERYWKFPSRKESLEKVIELIDDWLHRDPKNSVHLETSAKYGYEYLFQELFKEFRCKIYVEDTIYNLYWNLADVGKLLTNKFDETRICAHARINDVPCGDESVMHIRLSAQWYRWKKDQLVKPVRF